MDDGKITTELLSAKLGDKEKILEKLCVRRNLGIQI
jgi:hypothetical protein